MSTPDTLRWRLGGWLGGQLGGSVWIGLAGVLAWPHDAGAAAQAVALFLAANLIGFALWRSRARLSAHVGVQLLVLVVGIAGLGAVFALERAGVYEAVQIGGTVSAQATYGLIVLIVAALMLMFYLRFGRS